MLADDLQHAAICEWNGIIYAVGWREGTVWFEYSEDGGTSKAEIPGVGLRARVCEADEQQPAIEVLVTGEIVVAVDRSGRVETWYSADQGATWQPAA